MLKAGNACGALHSHKMAGEGQDVIKYSYLDLMYANLQWNDTH